MATKEDILEQIFEEYLLHKDYFVRHNINSDDDGNDAAFPGRRAGRSWSTAERGTASSIFRWVLTSEQFRLADEPGCGNIGRSATLENSPRFPLSHSLRNGDNSSNSSLWSRTSFRGKAIGRTV